ncbi:type II toxin-antitoxin system HicB family antitoxin [Burkholderia sp. USMB20]|nr:type II toxin-antitoxin system HicB family antitoxin [Burkholderia sp. USMB20]
MTVPDVRSVHSWGETMDETIENTRTADPRPTHL